LGNKRICSFRRCLFSIGEGTTEPNDNFISQLVDNAEAAINAVDALGYIDKNKVAVGGHSYGAFDC
jgi:dipeptidyl aminopeptidase/acylaminoacyl peptidase